jgi:exodeoxyribonuclease VII large subunit
VAEARSRLQQQQWALARLSPQAQIDNHRQRVDVLLTSAARTLRHHLDLQRQRVENLQAQLATLNPRATLNRGFAIVQKGEIVVTETGQVKAGDEIVVKVKDGQFGASVSQA